MKDEIKNYYGQVFVTAISLLGSDYIIKFSKSNEEFVKTYFDEDNLLYLEYILSDASKIQPFTKEKLNDLQKVMRYYIGKTDCPIKRKICLEIIQHAQYQKPSKLKLFCKKQYQERYNIEIPFRKIDSNRIELLEVALLSDSIVLTRLMDNSFEISSLTNESQYLLSINYLLNECPELLHNTLFMSRLEDVLAENMDCFEDKESKQLNETLFKEILDFQKRELFLSEQFYEQWLLSLIFSTDIDRVFENIKQQGIEEDYFNESTFNTFCEIIENNKESCMFDEEKIINARKILFHFMKTLPIDPKVVSEVRNNLNVQIDEKYKHKNKLFYTKFSIICGNYTYIDANAKELCDVWLSTAASVLWDVLNYNTSPEEASQHKYLPYQLNYILYAFPTIREDEAYLNKMKDMLWYKEGSIEIDSKEDVKIANHIKILEKKITKLLK